ncbi:MAG: DUF481 domain-containing protein [Proteobacteria bacterium]|nr:DUF481 domain-containing protein [Pseudomonadota bacterium]
MTCAELGWASDDVVKFASNSHMVGELKYLERGLLYFKTGTTGTISLEWPDVDELTSARRLRVELVDGNRFIGFLARSDEPEMLTVVVGTELLAFPMKRVVEIQPVEEEFLDRIDLKTRFGVNFTQSTDLLQVDLGIDLDYVTDDRVMSMDLSLSSSGDRGGESNERAQLDFSTFRLRQNNYINGYGLTFEKSDALGIDLRSSLRAVMGRFLIRNPQRVLLLAGGLQVTDEKYVTDQGNQQSLEAVGSIAFDWFSFSKPEFDLKTSLSVFPSLTDFGRVRARMDIVLAWELYKDVDWTLSFYNDYESDPQGDDSQSNDFGINTGITWDW